MIKQYNELLHKVWPLTRLVDLNRNVPIVSEALASLASHEASGSKYEGAKRKTTSACVWPLTRLVDLNDLLEASKMSFL